jgi:hypothetical protein
MHKFSTFQQNNLIVGTGLAAEIPSSALELRAFIVIGSYALRPKGESKLSNMFGPVSRPSKFLNRDHSDLRFRVHKYEIDKKYMGTSYEIALEQLAESIVKRDILNMEQLEKEVAIYLDDFSCLVVVWKFDPSLPFW